MEYINNEIKNILNSIAEGIAIIDRDFNLLFVNSTMAGFCGGLKEEDIAGKKCYELFHQCPAPCHETCFPDIKCPLSEVFNTGRALSVLHKHLMPDGSEKIFEISAFPLKDNTGNITQVIQVLRDVTECKKTEALLRTSSDEIHDLYNNAPAGYHSLDKDGIFVRINDTELSLLGYSREEIIGKKKFPDLLTVGSLQLFRENFPQFKESGWVKDLEFEMICKDGSVISVLLSATAIKDDAGNYVMSRSTIYDITEIKRTEDALKQSEAFIKNILESVDEGFIIIDPEYRIILANRAYCEQAKCKTENITGRHCYEVSHHNKKPCFLTGEECAPRHTFKNGTPYIALHTHFDSEGIPVYLETKSYPIKDASGKVAAVIETLNNLTEKRRLEEQLRHAQKMEAIGTLAGGIAHDFNNMLNVIIGYGGLMEMRMKKDDPFLPQIREILAASERAAQLTKGLLAFSRKQLLQMKPVNINDVIVGFKKILERIIGEDIELKFKTSDKDVIINADTGQIEQILMNLAANSRDAMLYGGVLTIEIGTKEIDQKFMKKHGFAVSGNYAFISVSDTGSGIDEITREKIFEPYFTTKMMGRGTGLGLSIVYGIVKQHGGYIDCNSEKDKGTSFTIYLPIAVSKLEDTEKNGALFMEGGKETILIAEDDAGVRNYIKELLKDFGYEIIEAVDGDEAVNKFMENKNRIQLLLFDVIMPRKNGKDAYDDIKTIRNDIKTIFMSGYSADFIKDRVSFKDIEYIQKPIKPSVLLRKIREVLDK
ncbi:MAG: hypothetical protein A2X59_08560 [Nitrospirae bacterium GWC2_42_7]|nr:MAG: hypothetical protein A2X59_08560 [Nitrospirae bacterium GWC2_42_7]